MSIDLTGLSRLGSVGLAKLLSEVPRGQAKEGISFAFKIKKAAWIKGDYGYRYHLDVVVRTLDMQAVLGSEVWKVYPSLLPQDAIEAIDTDTYDDTWFLVRTVINERSKADPKKTILKLIDTQQGLDAHSGPPKPAGSLDAGIAPVHTTGSERGQPAPGESHPYSDDCDCPECCKAEDKALSPGNPCLHKELETIALDENKQWVRVCTECGERVG